MATRPTSLSPLAQSLVLYSGLTFGATGEISALDGFASVDSTAEWEDRYVYLKSGPHALHFGDTDGGYDKAIIGIDTGGINDEADFYNFGDAGFDGLGDDGAHVLRYDYKADGLLGDGSATFSASYEENDGEDDGSIFGIGANADLAGFNVGVGYQMGTEADVDASIIGVSVGGTFDQFSVKGMLANASTDADEIEDVMGWAVSGVFDASDDLSVGVNASGAISDDELSEYTGFGVWADYSLGDGLTLTAAAGQSSPEEGDDETRFGFGLAMSF